MEKINSEALLNALRRLALRDAAKAVVYAESLMRWQGLEVDAYLQQINKDTPQEV